MSSKNTLDSGGGSGGSGGSAQDDATSETDGPDFGSSTASPVPNGGADPVDTSDPNDSDGPDYQDPGPGPRPISDLDNGYSGPSSPTSPAGNGNGGSGPNGTRGTGPTGFGSPTGNGSGPKPVDDFDPEPSPPSRPATGGGPALDPGRGTSYQEDTLRDHVFDEPRGPPIEDRFSDVHTEDEAESVIRGYAADHYRFLDAEDFRLVEAGDPDSPFDDEIVITDAGRKKLVAIETGYDVDDLRIEGDKVTLTAAARREQRKQQIREDVAAETGYAPGDLDVSIYDDVPERAGPGPSLDPGDRPNVRVTVSEGAVPEGRQPEADAGRDGGLVDVSAADIPYVGDEVQESVDDFQASADNVVRDWSGGEVGISDDWTSTADTGGVSGVYDEFTADYRSDVVTSTGEHFGDVDWSFGFGGPGDEVEQFVDAVPDRTSEFTRDVQEPVVDFFYGEGPSVFSGESAGHAVLDVAGFEDAADSYQSGVETFGEELLPQTAAGITSIPGTAMEATELLATRENLEDLPAAAAVAGVTQAQYLRDEPAKASAGIVGGYATGAGFGRFLGTTRLGRGRTGAAMRKLDPDPGKRIAKGTKRGVSGVRARLSRGDTDIDDIESGVDAPTPSDPSRWAVTRSDLSQRIRRFRNRLSRDRGDDVDAEAIPSGRGDVGTGGTGSVFDADALDEAMGVTGPSRIDRIRGSFRRQFGLDEPGESTARSGTFTTRSRSADVDAGDGSVTRTSELPLREQIQEAGGIRRYLDLYEVETRMGAGLVPPAFRRVESDVPDAPTDYSPNADLLDDALTQAQDQLGGRPRRPDPGDYEPAPSPFGRDGGDVLDPDAGTTLLERTSGTVTDVDGHPTTATGSTVFGSVGLTAGMTERQELAQRSEVLAEGEEPAGGNVISTGLLDAAEDSTFEELATGELGVFGTGEIPVDEIDDRPTTIIDTETTTTTVTDVRGDQTTTTTATPEPDPDLSPTPVFMPDPEPVSDPLFTPDPDPDPTPDPTPRGPDDLPDRRDDEDDEWAPWTLDFVNPIASGAEVLFGGLGTGLGTAAGEQEPIDGVSSDLEAARDELDERFGGAGR